ncbi:MAG TPA: glycosyltransferase family 9 protein [Ohtaekwangia sp.]|uniref:glycosyltransferase family 9 protein n=1 Tax=Ohtaekwangia sp. TaxID=2066019 RepID=UPI002F93A425
MKRWDTCRKILCVRLDNIGDVIMSSPAIRALKESFYSSITVMTSSAGGDAARLIPGVDDVITVDVPWVKLHSSPDRYDHILQLLRAKQFDAAVIFTVYSQSALPAAVLLSMANIPLRLAYCRENPYGLLSHWLPDEEPYTLIRHQVMRDLFLVRSVGAKVKDDRLTLNLPDQAWTSAKAKLQKAGVDDTKPFILLHPGVSEKKREYPQRSWMDVTRQAADLFKVPLLLTGATGEEDYTTKIERSLPGKAFSVAGMFSLDEFIMLVRYARLVVTVNTSTAHIAAATQTPVVVLYALTNPQHAPWKVPAAILPFDISESMRSRNEVIRYVHDHYYREPVPMVTPEEVVKAMQVLLEQSGIHAHTGAYSHAE